MNYWQDSEALISNHPELSFYRAVASKQPALVTTTFQISEAVDYESFICTLQQVTINYM